MKRQRNITFSIIALALLNACAGSTPQETPDGLVLQPDARFQEVYVLPGAELNTYEEVGLAECRVSFRRNWLRDQNNSRVDLSNRVTQEDVDRIKDGLAADCHKYFREALEEAPPYPLTDDFHDGQAVLIIRPAIVNLDINAPDTMSAGMSRTYTTSSGEMTLQLELTDATTGQVLARIMDRRRGLDTGRLQWTNGVTNRADADRALRHWAELMREGMDRATGR